LPVYRMGAVGESVTSTGRPFDKGEPYVTYCFVPAALLTRAASRD
jgi:hypothetical protein